MESSSLITTLIAVYALFKASIALNRINHMASQMADYKIRIDTLIQLKRDRMKEEHL